MSAQENPNDEADWWSSPPWPAAPEPAGPGDIVPFIPDEDIDLRQALPPYSGCMANGGRLLITLALREMAWEDYDAYLRTNHWQSIRGRTYEIHGARCTLGVECSGPLDVHHRTYENLGDEQPEDTEVLCRKHHEMKHETYRAFVRDQAAKQFRP